MERDNAKSTFLLSQPPSFLGTYSFDHDRSFWHSLVGKRKERNECCDKFADAVDIKGGTGLCLYSRVEG